MDKKIETAIRETLVIGNPVSIKRCVDKLKLIFEQEQALRQASVSGSVCDECTDGSGWYGCEDITYNCSKCNPEAN